VSRKGDLTQLARGFAESLQELLNQTVCEGAHVGAVLHPDGRTAAIGTGLYGVSRAGPVRLRTQGEVPCWLTIACRVYLDREGYLTVEQSVYFLHTGTDPDHLTELLHYDYERDKEGYPEAHIQVIATSEAWEAVLAASGRPKAGVGKLHLPVGGRRFRPALEDLIEALINEQILDGAPGWPRIINEHREDFRRLQLRAAIRREPEVAALALQALGYTVAPPDQSTPGKIIQFGRSGRSGRRGGDR
jgi:hypothetical protein